MLYLILHKKCLGDIGESVKQEEKLDNEFESVIELVCISR